MRKWLIFVVIYSILLAGCASAVQVTPERSQGAAQTPVEVTEAAVTELAAEAAATEAVVTEAAATEEPAAEAAGPQELTRAITSEPSSLDPQGVAGAGQNVVLPYLFDTLVYRDLDNSYQPYLAEKWDVSEDGKTVTFTLREGITFHDGTPLDAEAVKFTFDRLIEQGQQSPLASLVANIASMDVEGSTIVRFNFIEPSTTFLSSISIPYAGIVSPQAASAAGESFGQAPVGSGAYIFEKWEPGVAITLVKNPNYAWAPPVVDNQGVPHLDRLVFKVIPDVSQQVTALQAGEVDVLFINQTSHVEKLKQDPNVSLVETTLNSLVYLGFNLNKPPFDDVRVRQALSHAVNKAELVQVALGGIGEPAFAPLAPTLPGFDPSLKANELGFDLDKMNSLLTDAGFTKAEDGVWMKDGQPFTVSLLTSTRPPNQSLATVLQSQFKTAGVTVEIQMLDSAAAQEAAGKGSFDLLLWRYDWNDADVLRVYLSSDRIGRTNRNFYSNPQVDEMLNQAAAEMDEAARNALYLEAQKLILEDAPWQPLYTPKDFMAVRANVENVVMGPMGRMMLNDAVKR